MSTRFWFNELFDTVTHLWLDSVMNNNDINRNAIRQALKTVVDINGKWEPNHEFWFDIDAAEVAIMSGAVAAHIDDDMPSSDVNEQLALGAYLSDGIWWVKA